MKKDTGNLKKEKIFSQDELAKVALDLITKVSKLKNKEATTIALSGELGAGKTTLTKDIGKLLGIKEIMISPTFVIMKYYKLTESKYNWKNLIHIDAYRLDSSDELLKLGWEELRENKDNLIIIEWPERVPECLSGHVYRVNLGHKSEGTRTIEILV